MSRYAFRIVNVFAEAPLAGNPLAVFEDGGDLDEATMQALALQFNLSETTFILPSTAAVARVRIFTPSFEMPFAGHPTLGTAHVVRSLLEPGNCVLLEMKAGQVEVVGEPAAASGKSDVWTLRTAQAPQTRPAAAVRGALAAMLGLSPQAVSDTPLW